MNGYGNSLKPYKADSRTTEIRMLEGTLSPFKTKDWVTILLGLFEYSQEIPIPEINIPYDPVYWADFMLDSIVARYTRSKGLWDRLRKYRSQADKWGFDHGGNPVQ